MNEYTHWRLQPDGRDIWHGSVTVRRRPAGQPARQFVADLCRDLDRDSLRRMQAPLDQVLGRRITRAVCANTAVSWDVLD